MKKTFKITGMHCTSCAKLIESELSDKVKSIHVNHETGKAKIDFDENKISESEIKKIISEQGYKSI